jgi:hypothetical protein
MKTRALATLCLCLAGAAASRGFDFMAYLDSPGANDVTAVASRKAKSYVRIQRGDGSYRPETYVFGEGGSWRGEDVDDTIDKLNFRDVAHMLAGPLASQSYIPGTDPFTTKLIIMVYWGTTHAPEHAPEANGYVNLQAADNALFISTHQNGKLSPVTRQLDDVLTTAMAAVVAENRMRTQDDVLNVNMLGYDSWWDNTERYDFTPMGFRRQDLLDEIEEDRYFVVLMAYDLQQIRMNKKNRLLWETRFSIRERHHAFNEDLPGMASSVSQFFGQDSHGLVHREVKLGHVDVGEVQSLGEASPPPPDRARLPDKP